VRAVVQRVTSASVTVDDRVTGEIGAGLLVLLGVEQGDAVSDVQYVSAKIRDLRIFADDAGKMNLNVRQIGGGLLLVPQFTLVADTRKGTRPGFSGGAPPDQARELFEALLLGAEAAHSPVASGVFGADMQVHLVNDGPVTFLLHSP